MHPFSKQFETQNIVPNQLRPALIPAGGQNIAHKVFQAYPSIQLVLWYASMNADPQSNVLLIEIAGYISTFEIRRLELQLIRFLTLDHASLKWHFQATPTGSRTLRRLFPELLEIKAEQSTGNCLYQNRHAISVA